MTRSALTRGSPPHFQNQIDGEPWLQKPAVFDVQYHNRVRMLKNTASSSFIPEDLPLTADASDWVMPLSTKEK